MSGPDQAIWDLIHYDLIDELIIPLVEEALKEHQERTYKLLNDYVVSRATTMVRQMSTIQSPSMKGSFARDLPPIPMILAGEGPPPVFGGNSAVMLPMSPGNSLPPPGESSRDRGSRGGSRSAAASMGSASASAGAATPKEVRFSPVDTPESAADLPQIIVDYMQHQDADVFADSATSEEHMLAERFKGVLQMAVEGKLSSWEDDALSLVALVIALDQFPRTIYRAKKKMYIGETQLKDVLARAVDETGVIQDVPPMHMLFCCLALSHLEDIFSQKLGVKLWKSVTPTFSTHDEIHKYGKVFESNLAIIEELGRFPQRNKLLGRESTPQEEVWQQEKRAANAMRLQRAAIAAKGDQSPVSKSAKKSGRFRLFQSLGRKAKQSEAIKG
jgi:uncharacterized protein (DUF924 family)